MRYLVPCVEQMDRAAEELHDGSVVSSRLSLILTDNIVELMLHRKCDYTFRSKRTLWTDPVEGGRYSRVNQHRVLGHHFDEKAKFLLAEGDLTEQEFGFIRICHAIRGEAYHTGLTHDEILLALAWEYHALACDLFGRFKSPTRSYNPRASVPPRFSKHIAPIDAATPMRAFSFAKEPELAASLNCARPHLSVSLPVTLANHMQAKVERLEKQLQYLASGNPDDHNLEKMLLETQWWHDLFTDIPLAIEDHSDAYSEYIRQKAETMRRSWKPKYTQLPLDSWKQRIERMRSANRYSALTRHEQLGAEIEHIMDAVEKAAGALDAHIEEQIERRREARRD